MKPKKIEDILKAINQYDKKIFHCFSYYQHFIFDSREILNLVLNNTKNNKLIEIAKENHIINLVRSIENCLKNMLTEFIDDLNFPYNEVVEKITKKLEFNEILLFYDQKIKMGELLAFFFNFQNVDEIQKVYSNLFQVPSFFDYMKNNVGMNDLSHLIVSNIEDEERRELIRNYLFLDENLYQDLDEIINIRHDLIHNTRKEVKLNLEKIDYFESLAIRFLFSVDACGRLDIVEKFRDN